MDIVWLPLLAMKILPFDDDATAIGLDNNENGEMPANIDTAPADDI